MTRSETLSELYDLETLRRLLAEHGWRLAFHEPSGDVPIWQSVCLPEKGVVAEMLGRHEAEMLRELDERIDALRKDLGVEEK